MGTAWWKSTSFHIVVLYQLHEVPVKQMGFVHIHKDHGFVVPLKNVVPFEEFYKFFSIIIEELCIDFVISSGSNLMVQLLSLLDSPFHIPHYHWFHDETSSTHVCQHGAVGALLSTYSLKDSLTGDTNHLLHFGDVANATFTYIPWN